MMSASLTCLLPKRTIASCFTAESRATKKPYNTARGIVIEIGHNTTYIQNLLMEGQVRLAHLFILISFFVV